MTLKRTHQFLLNLPRGVKRAILWLMDLTFLPVAYLVAKVLRFSRLPEMPYDWTVLVTVSVVTVAILQLTGFYRVVIRYMDPSIFRSLLPGIGLSILLLYTMAYIDPSHKVPRSIFVIYGFIAIIYLVGIRIWARSVLRLLDAAGTRREPILVFGAGAAGMQLVTTLYQGGPYRPAVLVDDSPSLQGQNIYGLPVFNRKRLPAWLATHPEVRTAVLVVPSATEEQRRLILQYLQRLGLVIKTLPSLADLISGKSRLSDLRDVNVSDLLNREVVDARSELVAEAIAGTNVLVTGAGGSIGSALCRTILAAKPARLVLFEASEYALYEIERELRALPEAEGVDIVPVLATILYRAVVRQTLQRFCIHTVFHAAAYKHVPMVEANIAAGVRNNTIGTWIMAEEAIACGVGRFILVSTDKAVRPTNIMGASKRMAELVLQALNSESFGTVLAMVRFGNVLDSSGSVVPSFRRQITDGGPVTVTHPDITRYFMTIPEAACLVVQAGAMAQGGDVFLLDMGKPVKIDDLARTMIQLMGKTVRGEDGRGDIAIEYTGLRPGEKLYEELLIDSEAEPTRHPKIYKAKEPHLPWLQLKAELVWLLEACEHTRVDEIRDILARCVTGYTPDERRVDPFGETPGPELPLQRSA